MSRKVLRRGLLTLVALAALAGGAIAQTWAPFYNEVPKDGRIYVFASGQRYDAFVKGGGVEIGVAITRPGYGPNGETVVFDSEDAINLYNFKHNLPGEYFPKPKEAPKSPYPAGKFSGLMFGDYYWYDKWHQDQISDTNKTGVQGQQGFWLRRIYFTYDLTFSEKFTTRLRIEMNSNGQFAGGNLNPYVKDAYLKWTFTGKQALTLGIQPSLTFDWVEGFWGLRHIEKTPEDLYRIDSSRDFGLTLGGPVTAVKNLSYAAQVGNDSGNGSEADKYKIVRLEARYDMNPGIAVEGTYFKSKRPNGQDRELWHGFVGWRNKIARVGGLYTWQKRESGKDGVPDQKIDIWSAFAVWEFAPKKADVFFRFDKVKGDLDGQDTGLPGADGIDYWIMSTKQPFKNYIGGFEYYLHPSIRVSPNVEWVKYDADPDPVKYPGRDQDRLYRITFFWTW
jgi:hypothetical protein